MPFLPWMLMLPVLLSLEELITTESIFSGLASIVSSPCELSLVVLFCEEKSIAP